MPSMAVTRPAPTPSQAPFTPSSKVTALLSQCSLNEFGMPGPRMTPTHPLRHGGAGCGYGTGGMGPSCTPSGGRGGFGGGGFHSGGGGSFGVGMLGSGAGSGRRSTIAPWPPAPSVHGPAPVSPELYANPFRPAPLVASHDNVFLEQDPMMAAMLPDDPICLGPPAAAAAAIAPMQTDASPPPLLPPRAEGMAHDSDEAAPPPSRHRLIHRFHACLSPPAHASAMVAGGSPPPTPRRVDAPPERMVLTAGRSVDPSEPMLLSSDPGLGFGFGFGFGSGSGVLGSQSQQPAAEHAGFGALSQGIDAASASAFTSHPGPSAPAPGWSTARPPQPTSTRRDTTMAVAIPDTGSFGGGSNGGNGWRDAPFDPLSSSPMRARHAFSSHAGGGGFIGGSGGSALVGGLAGSFASAHDTLSFDQAVDTPGRTPSRSREPLSFAKRLEMQGFGGTAAATPMASTTSPSPSLHGANPFAPTPASPAAFLTQRTPLDRDVSNVLAQHPVAGGGGGLVGHRPHHGTPYGRQADAMSPFKKRGAFGKPSLQRYQKGTTSRAGEAKLGSLRVFAVPPAEAARRAALADMIVHVLEDQIVQFGLASRGFMDLYADLAKTSGDDALDEATYVAALARVTQQGRVKETGCRPASTVTFLRSE
ncbi:hypothetical protein CXG81DRAFT_18802 [Caulochytrium protostelioides]|uniref:Uncharacterized protein n=1 Tax=Caulochytrium protostelioides TaxID=1555241 RepID=A0A4P9X829_9FUNG|nr:hypothetical protein CXG81DRAFT_18802 [Caulochytrium protostelioides]|eukprot:RKP01382.1 hypothetical protein CXG81DRAFT_18802 [Caulochytrium protostelioides]